MTAPPPAPGPQPHPPPRTTRPGEFLAGDGIRGIGTVCVIMAHIFGGATLLAGVYSEGFRAAYGTVPGTFAYGLQLVLPLFFVLSGYLISRPWVRAYVSGKRLPRLGPYARLRVLRIVPVFWLMGGLMLLQYGTHGASVLDLAEIFGFGQIYYHQTAASLFLGQAWSIDVEVAFYALVPASAWLLTVATDRFSRRTGRDLDPRGRVALLVSLLAVATVASAYMRGTTVATAWNESLPATFYYFAPGVALAALELELSSPLARSRLRRLAPIFGLSAGLIAVGLSIAVSRDALALIHARGALAVAVGSGLALAALLARQLARGDSPRWVDNRATRWLGARSYPCYILQSAALGTAVVTFGRVGGPRMELLAMTAFVLPVTIAAGAVVHATIERPLLQWGHSQRRRTGVARAEATVDPVVPDPRLLTPVVAAGTDLNPLV